MKWSRNINNKCEANQCEKQEWELEELNDYVSDEVDEDYQEIKKEKWTEKLGKRAKKLLNPCFLGIICSLIITGFGVATICGVFFGDVALPKDMSLGQTVSSRYYSYGGDAYTGIQNAAADASKNAAAAARNIEVANYLILSHLSNTLKITRSIFTTVGILITSIGTFGLFYFWSQLSRRDI